MKIQPPPLLPTKPSPPVRDLISELAAASALYTFKIQTITLEYLQKNREFLEEQEGLALHELEVMRLSVGLT